MPARTKKFLRQYLTFAEKPASAEELAIVYFLADLFYAYNHNDADLIIKFFSKSALIDSITAHGVIDVIRYRNILEQQLDILRKTTFSDIRIVVRKDALSDVYGTFNLFFKDGKRMNNEYLLRLTYTKGGWYIQETQYITRHLPQWGNSGL